MRWTVEPFHGGIGGKNIGHLLAGRGIERALIAHLPASLGIERRPVQNQFAFFAKERPRCLPRSACHSREIRLTL